jgi:hypothetical protein
MTPAISSGAKPGVASSYRYEDRFVSALMLMLQHVRAGDVPAAVDEATSSVRSSGTASSVALRTVHAASAPPAPPQPRTRLGPPRRVDAAEITRIAIHMYRPCSVPNYCL